MGPFATTTIEWETVNSSGERPAAIRLHSPAWGVTMHAPRTARSTPGCRASASSTTGRASAATCAATHARVSASRPRPGPITHASIRSPRSWIRCRPSSANPPSGVSGQPTQIASGAAAANAGTSDSGTNAETRPAPLRNAAFTANKAAPG